MVGLSSWVIAQHVAVSYSSVLEGARVIAYVRGSAPVWERRLVAANESTLRVNGDEVYVRACLSRQYG